MKEWDDQMIDSFHQGLMCAGLHNGLRSILLFDAGFEHLRTIVPVFREILEIGRRSSVESVILPAMPRDDDLWGTFIPKPANDRDLSGGKSGLSVVWQEGLLTRNRLETRHLLVVIPDLSRINTALARACVMLLDSPVANMQRHGQDHAWSPDITWLAACDRNKIGRVTEHLLDRFAIRLSTPQLINETKGSKIKQLFDDSEKFSPPGERYSEDRLSFIRDKMKKAEQHHLDLLSSETIQMILEQYFPQGTTLGVRRELALARMSQALARLDLSSGVTRNHLEKAAKIIGLPDIPSDADDTGKKPEPEAEKKKPDSFPSEQQEPKPPDLTAPVIEPTTGLDSEPRSCDPETFPPRAIQDTSPYPEDRVPVEREQFSLRLPMRRHSPVSDDRGVILGDEPARTLNDLAIVPTIVEAAIFQNIRRKNDETLPTDRLVIFPADLRTYRREPKPDKMLILVIDYTCLRDCKWQDSLLPHLRWAYVNRASVCIVQVGAAMDGEGLRAKKIMAKKVLSSAVEEALEAGPGKATPLAHGLDLAYHTIRQTRFHGRERFFQTRLVVITDGRGNVPLIASREGKIKRPVNREGIDDALDIANNIYRLKRVRAVLLDPQPRYHPEFPVMLADAMGAVRETVDAIDDL